jgi:myo-inositol-1(or 4)-monophosphatase
MDEGFFDCCDRGARTAEELRDNIHGIREITYKGDINLVTEMDMRSERSIVESLHSAFPGHGIIAEEETDIRHESGFTWIIDPLDGTTNYAHGYPCFSVSIALQREDEILVGVVYDPMRGELFTAQKGQGAALNGKKIHVSEVDTLIKSLLATGFPMTGRSARKTTWTTSMISLWHRKRFDVTDRLRLISVLFHAGGLTVSGSLN